VLLAAFDARRPTRDVDLAAVDLANDVDDIRALVTEILAVARDDGLEFDPTATTAATIRDDDLYGGVRTTVHGSLSTFVVQFHIDVNLGDPLWPTPEEVEVPRLLGGAPIRMRGYRVELILAEKIVTAIRRGTANTRWRDFVDIACTRPPRCQRWRAGRVDQTGCRVPAGSDPTAPGRPFWLPGDRSTALGWLAS
jgi:hypothetical protein